MKKYFKIYDDEKKQMRRFPVLTGLYVEAHLESDKCRVRFCDKQTGLCPFYVDLSIGDEKLEKFCEDLITCKMTDIIEKYMRWATEKDYNTFLLDSHRTWPFNKMAEKWASELKLLLKMVCLREGHDVAQLALDIRKISGK